MELGWRFGSRGTLWNAAEPGSYAGSTGNENGRHLPVSAGSSLMNWPENQATAH